MGKISRQSFWIDWTFLVLSFLLRKIFTHFLSKFQGPSVFKFQTLIPTELVHLPLPTLFSSPLNLSSMFFLLFLFPKVPMEILAIYLSSWSWPLSVQFKITSSSWCLKYLLFMQCPRHLSYSSWLCLSVIDIPRKYSWKHLKAWCECNTPLSPVVQPPFQGGQWFLTWQMHNCGNSWHYSTICGSAHLGNWCRVQYLHLSFKIKHKVIKENCSLCPSNICPQTLVWSYSLRETLRNNLTAHLRTADPSSTS